MCYTGAMDDSYLSNLLPEFKPPQRKSGATPHRGAPLGNRNAFKHGFYAAAFSPKHILALKKTEPYSVQDEIAALRLLLRESLLRPNQGDPSLAVQENLRNFTFGCLAMSRLFRIEMFMRSQPDPDYQQSINQAIDEAAEELGIYDDDDPPAN